ncbi:MAG: acyl-CoA/acyl-ACP dehydrogenase, partial [Armatimonadota bacterium]|nr:acyl-CoA/acyl-ACP dehydrogenase [Armatimonadota bacterium]
MNEDILQEAWRLADQEFRPQAEEADQGDITGQVGQNVRKLADAGYFGLGISPEWGGMGADDVTRREYTELMASACGVTAFVQQ